jgi:tRNA-(ms[2]io[6]A)-hydroxylase
MENTLKAPTDGLPLALATSDEWLQACARAPERVLVDHAHCELKAASTALRLVGRYGDRARLADELTALAREEMRHFERVRAVILERKIPFTAVGPDDYVKALRARAQRGIAGVATLLDTLVICAFVEARSCERFRILGAGPFDDELRALWTEFAEAEARHHELFLDLAREATDESQVAKRVKEVAAIEAKLVTERGASPRMH